MVPLSLAEHLLHEPRYNVIIDVVVTACKAPACDLQHNLYNMNPIERILSVFAPHICVGCGYEGSVFCFECRDSTEALPSICYICGKATRSNKTCTDCINRMHPEHVWMFTSYKDTPKSVLWAYKFHQQRAAALPVAECTEQTLPYFAESPLVTFVPTATRHRRQRGFDHAELLAKELARLRGWHYAPLLSRVSQVQQKGATRLQRKEQLKNVFVAHNRSLIKDAHVLLVDDVVTTGATLEACARVLKKAGAARVDAAVFARTPTK